MDIKGHASGASTTDPRELWARTHGRAPQVVYTELNGTLHGLIVVSTVLLTSGRTMRDGPFQVFESRVFSQALGDRATSLNHRGNARDGARKAIQEHVAIVQAIADVCFGS
jgi:hypothetical protein